MKYMKPLKSLESNRVLIDSVLVDEIFYSIPEILQHHENFLGALQDRLSSDWDSSQVIGNVFIEAFTNQQIIDDYTAFINNWKNARQAIKVATQAKPAFERFLEAMSREHRNKLTLDALLIMPVQRIPRYELLIKELIKHTPEDHQDYEPLIEAQKKIHELALKIDRAEKEMIHQEQLRDLEALIEGHIELQHHQRDFIRYDLVTIVSASALAATKKERVLFLFCDLLIMTSIKKKASRRSNLQNAFANSTNDLSLLEGNKFKLLLRVPLDQIEIRLDYNQIQLQQQHQEEQYHYQLQRQSKLIQERRREVEADLHALQQMESLAANLNHAHRAKLSDVIIDMVTDVRQKLASIENNDMHLLNDEHYSTLGQHNSAQDLYLTPSPASISSITSAHHQQPLQLFGSSTQNSSSNLIAQGSHQPQLQGSGNSPLPASNQQQDSSTSLEFLIKNNTNNGVAGKESSGDFLTLDHHSSVGQTISSATEISNQPSSGNSESLVVTFASIERRQAFIQAFIEAKQQRFQQKQQQQQQQLYNQGKIFSSSVTLKLAPPGSAPSVGTQEKRVSGPELALYRHESADAYQARTGLRPSSLSGPASGEISTATPSQHQMHHPCNSAIVHQMSAPQSLDLASSSILDGSAGIKVRSSSSQQCTSCSYNEVAEAEKAQLRHRDQHHHHHQLMHQPTSHPACLDTFCCHELHTNWHEGKASHKPPKGTSHDECNMNAANSRRQCMDHNENMIRQIGLNSVVNLNDNQIDSIYKSTLTYVGDGSGEDQAASGGRQLMDQMNFNLLLAKCAPKFLVTLPVDFLSTQHPALQFTCSTLGRNHHYSGDSKIESVDCSSDTSDRGLKSKRAASQVCEDNLGRLWLCMSNGYVSHVALVTIKKRTLNRLANVDQPEQTCGSSTKCCYSITPVVISAGDICKSHINCIAQVKWSKSSQACGFNVRDKKEDTSTSMKVGKNETQPKVGEEIAIGMGEKGQPTDDMDIQSSAIDLKCKNQTYTSSQESNLHSGVRLSESAPSRQSPIDPSLAPDSSIRNFSSASTSKLEMPQNTPLASNGRCKSLHHHNQRSFTMQTRPGGERKRSIHDKICHGHLVHHSGSAKHLNNRTAPSSLQQITRPSKHHHSNQHHSHHHNHHFNHHSHIYLHHPDRGKAQQHNLRVPNYHRNGSGHGHGGHTHSHQHHHHHHHHHQHQNHHHHQHPQHHHHHSTNHHHHQYGTRHNTVPIADLRKQLKRQDTVEQLQQPPENGQFLSPQTSAQRLDSSLSTRSNSPVQKYEKPSSFELVNQRSASPQVTRPTTPTSFATASLKGFRSARLMRHQASLKTSSILAKLVGGATRRSAYMRRSNPAHDKSSDLDDNDTEPDTTGAQHQRQETPLEHNDLDTAKKDMIAATGSHKIMRTPSHQLDPAMMLMANSGNSPVISPLSSVSSLNSTTSSYTVNSACASSPNRSSCELLAHSYSTTCCMSGGGGGGLTSSTKPVGEMDSIGYSASQTRGEVCGHRGRSATAPSRPLCDQVLNRLRLADCTNLTHHKSFAIDDRAAAAAAGASKDSMKMKPAGRPYKVSEIVHDTLSGQEHVTCLDSGQQKSIETTTMKQPSSGASKVSYSATRAMNSSLWLGCDDGSLIIIDCLMADDDPQPHDGGQSCDCNTLESRKEQKTFTCGNVHSEIKLSSPICDISTYKEEKVFVALSNGQLAVFSRVRVNGATDCTSNDLKDQEVDGWALTDIEIITVTESELNSTARLCQVNESFLWYSYGRNIFILNISTLKLETTIMAPTNDLSLRLNVQAITIDNMELVQNLSGIWVSFRNSHLIQFYDINSHKLLVEINLFEPINKLLSYGNEIIRQHKTACLKATSLLNYHNEREQCNTLFVGTSAGIILYLTVSPDQLTSRDQLVLDWKPQLASLRHGHSGHVKLLRLIEMDDDQGSVEPSGDGERGQQQSEEENTSNVLDRSNLYLISGGTGLDIYGPNGEQQNFISQLNSDEDSLNHLMIWQL